MKEQILAVQRMQDYIEKNLSKTITLSDFSKVSLFSPLHSHRLFRKYTGFSPADYIRRLRLSKSALRLKNEDCRVIDAALDTGFGSADGYTRAFFREFGCNSKEYALSPVPIALFIPYGVKFKELRKDNTDVENYFSYCEEVGCDVRGLLASMDSLCGEPVCLWLPGKVQKNKHLYLCSGS